MRIGVIADNDLNNDKRVLRETGILKEAGHEIFVLCFGFKGNENPVNGLNITRIRISRKTKNALFFFINLVPVYELMWANEIKKLIIRNNIEALHVHDLYMARAAHKGIRHSGKKIPLILDLHENYPYAVTTYNWTKGLLRSILSQAWKWQVKEKEYLHYADKIIVLSNEFRDTLVTRYPELDQEKFIAFPNVPDLSREENHDTFEIKNRPGPGQTCVMYFGVVAERRGIFDVLDVFSALAKEDHPSVFMIIGPVDRKDKIRFLNLIRSETLNNKVIYIPWIDLSELPAYLDITDICIAPFLKNPQHESGVANKIFDYMYGKKPLIVSDCKPQRMLVEKYNCGLVYSNPEEMKAAIERLSSDPMLRSEMGMNGYNAIINENNMGLVKERITSLYSSLKPQAC